MRIIIVILRNFYDTNKFLFWNIYYVDIVLKSAQIHNNSAADIYIWIEEKLLTNIIFEFLLISILLNLYCSMPSSPGLIYNRIQSCYVTLQI